MHLSVDQDVFRATNKHGYPVKWSVRAEADGLPERSARALVKVDGEQAADIRVYQRDGQADVGLPQEVQEVCSAIVWSRLRAIARDRGWAVGVFAPDTEPEEEE